MRLHTAEQGSGPRTALLVHGLFSDGTCWHRVAPALAARGFTVAVPDLRGHGSSPRGRYSPADWANDLVDTFLDRPVDLAVGHSLGGLSLAIAAHALRPRRTVYLDPAWRLSAADDARSRAVWTSWLSWTGIEQLRTTLGERWPDADVELRWASMWRTDPAVVAGLATGAGYDHSPESAPSPALVLAADPSGYITPEHAADLRERGLVVERVRGSGHSWFREDSEAFLARLDRWLAETG